MDQARNDIFMQGLAAGLAGMVDDGSVLEAVQGMQNEEGDLICWRVTIRVPNKAPKLLLMNAQILTSPIEIQ
jgi:hypothetical protein